MKQHKMIKITQINKEISEPEYKNNVKNEEYKVENFDKG